MDAAINELPFLAALLFNALSTGAATSFITGSITGKKVNRVILGINLGSFLVMGILKLWLSEYLSDTLYAASTILLFMLYAIFCMRFGVGTRGVSTIWWALLLVGTTMMVDLLLSIELAASSALGIPLEAKMWLPTDGWRHQDPLRVMLNGLLSAVNICLIGLAARVVRRIWQGRQPRVVFIVVREVTLAVSFVGIYVLLTGQTIAQRYEHAGDFSRYIAEYGLIWLLCIPALCVIASYIIQDIQYLRQIRLNRLYEYQRKAYEAVLGSQRHFRHNIINMLYGFEGVMHSDDSREISRYYEQLIEKCALVNNDNVLALQRVTQPALNGLLLRVLDQARERSLPMQLHVDEGLNPCKHLNAVDLCQIVGVLADNALEAAEKADIRYVGISLSRLEGGGMELLVRNTYAGEVKIEQLRRESARPDSERGHGLPSCYAILRRNGKVFLNFHVTRQYVEAQLLL